MSIRLSAGGCHLGERVVDNVTCQRYEDNGAQHVVDEVVGGELGKQFIPIRWRSPRLRYPAEDGGGWLVSVADIF